MNRYTGRVTIQTDQPKPGGWAFPNNSHSRNMKAHAWEEATLLAPSVCGKWGYAGTHILAPLDGRPSPDDCKMCRSLVNKDLEAKGKKPAEW